MPSYADLAAAVDYGYGMFLFLVSIVPSEWYPGRSYSRIFFFFDFSEQERRRWVIEALGFEGNRQKGLQLVTAAAQLKSPLGPHLPKNFGILISHFSSLVVYLLLIARLLN